MLLEQMMGGAVEVLNAAGCTLVGGHTGEGQELALGFALSGLVDIGAQGQLQGVLQKGGMQTGDVLILTKPLGTGTLFAAHALGQARGRWVEAALDSMCQSSQTAAQIVQTHGATACTDITGFGLLGHLVEMARASSVDVEIDLNALPALDGALECLQMGTTSSLHSANARQGQAIANADSLSAAPEAKLRLALLFDPQTAGGLLASVSTERAQDCVSALRAAGYAHSAIVARVRGAGLGQTPVWLVEQ
jgi:selenide,water dikinase